MEGNRYYVIILWGRPYGDPFEYRHECWKEVLRLKAALADPDQCFMLEGTVVEGYEPD